MTETMKVTLKPSVVEILRKMKGSGDTNGIILQRVFEDLARMEETFKTILLDLRNRIFNPTLLSLAVKAKAKEIWRVPTAWVRICAFGVTQLEVDQMRKFFPDIIPGHSTISDAKKVLVEKIERVIPILQFPDGHGHDLGTLLVLAARVELENFKERIPKALVIVFSLDAKLLYSEHYTQVSFR